MNTYVVKSVEESVADLSDDRVDDLPERVGANNLPKLLCLAARIGDVDMVQRVLEKSDRLDTRMKQAREVALQQAENTQCYKTLIQLLL